ncbi:MAG: cytochrome c maturation protein CcmE [Alphaproteobacteria bacterium]|nr:cytochrome c maturation protein CcmE [Alphaproteobacteria bacterium]MCB9697968.1 cytochrome c maturation protein CcmE [Alphaproteobacteria bacterium]
MTDAMKKRLFGVVAVVVALSALGFIGMSDIGRNVTYYWSPTELAAASNAKDATVRLGGMVVAGTYTWDQDAHLVTFDITDNKTTVKVRNEGNPPQMFREGIGVVVEGRLGADGVFHSDKVMVSHGSEYQPPGEGESPADVYKNLPQTLQGS